MLLARSKTVVDLVDQAATIGELHHAIFLDWCRRTMSMPNWER